MFRKFICTTVLTGMLLGGNALTALADSHDYAKEIENVALQQEQRSESYQNMNWTKSWDELYDQRDQWLEQNAYYADFFRDNKGHHYQVYKLNLHPDYLIVDSWRGPYSFQRMIKDQNNRMGYMGIQVEVLYGKFKGKVKWVNPNDFSNDEFMNVAKDCFEYNQQ